MPRLTPRQHEVLNFIEQHIESYSYAPSYREIQNHFGYQSVGTVYNLVRALRKKGVLESGDRLHRTFEIVHSPTNQHKETDIRLIGTLSAGEPIHFEKQPQVISVPKAMTPNPEKTYLLRVKGNQFQNQGINEGDLLVIEARQDPQEGETILVLLKETGAEIKRFSLTEKGILLTSDGLQQKSMITSSDQLRMIGVILGLLRLY